MGKISIIYSACFVGLFFFLLYNLILRDSGVKTQGPEKESKKDLLK